MTQAKIELHDGAEGFSATVSYSPDFVATSAAHQHAWLLGKVLDGLCGENTDPHLAAFAAKFGLSREEPADPGTVPSLTPSSTAVDELMQRLRDAKAKADANPQG